jgi:hypothetical protein
MTSNRPQTLRPDVSDYPGMTVSDANSGLILAPVVNASGFEATACVASGLPDTIGNAVPRTR